MDAGNLKKDNNINGKFGGQGMNPNASKGTPTPNAGGF